MSQAELQTIIDAYRAREAPNTPTVEYYREMIETVAAAREVPDDLISEPVEVAGRPAEWVSAPDAAPDKAILYLHGGGYLIGSPNTHRLLAYCVAKASGMRTLLIDYRLAPEHPFPAAPHDSVAAYQWLLDQGFAPDKLAICGDSAGGGLTVATLIVLKNDDIPLPACAICLSPWVDMEMTGESLDLRAELDPVLDRKLLAWMAKTYLDGASVHEAQASPIHGNLSGLPEILIQVGTAEVLYDDAVMLHSAVRIAGTPCRLEVWQDMIHVWHTFSQSLSEARDALNQIGRFLREKIKD